MYFKDFTFVQGRQILHNYTH